MPTDQDYGLGNFLWKGRSIGGILKSIPDDFVVTECDPVNKLPINQIVRQYNSSNNGLFLVGEVVKKGIDHSRMISLLSRFFKVDEKAISTAGIKDAKAITTQLFSVYQPKRIPSHSVKLSERVSMKNFRYQREKVYPGSMGGNHFKIKIRNTKSLEKDELDLFGNFITNGLINYYGYQRFGGINPITATMGRLLNNNQYKTAIGLYLGQLGEEEFRTSWINTQDPQEVLKHEHIPRIEKNLLTYLNSHKGDFQGATKRFPDYLIKLFNSAFISSLTNRYLSQRGLNSKLLSGERNVINNIEIAVPSRKWDNPLNEIWQSVFEESSLDMNELRNIRHTTRLLKLHVYDWKFDIINNDELDVEFRLENGSYATVVLREIMQSQVDAYC